jgi:hypothetical protein
MKKNVLFLFAALSMPLIYANKKATVSVDLTYVGINKTTKSADHSARPPQHTRATGSA